MISIRRTGDGFHPGLFTNNLKPYDYFEYLLTEIPKHLDDTDRSFLDDLIPWSPGLPENCRKPGKNEVK